MKKRLYRVSCRIDLVVLAKDDLEAEREAEDLVDVRDGGAVVDAHATELFSERSLPDGWTGLALPFGGDGKTTIAQYILQQDIAEKTK